jgi:hypothetical protein
MTSTREERFRSIRVRGLFLAAAFGGGSGLFGLFTGLNRPSIANMRTIDLVHLLVTGAGLGVGLLSLALLLVGRRQG